MDTTWQHLFPEGRTLFYEGRNARRFVRKMRAKFGLVIVVTRNAVSTVPPTSTTISTSQVGGPSAPNPERTRTQ